MIITNQYGEHMLLMEQLPLNWIFLKLSKIWFITKIILLGWLVWEQLLLFKEIGMKQITHLLLKMPHFHLWNIH